eukprot:5389659-Prymnesium_polylepis.2
MVGLRGRSRRSVTLEVSDRVSRDEKRSPVETHEVRNPTRDTIEARMVATELFFSLESNRATRFSSLDERLWFCCWKRSTKCEYLRAAPQRSATSFRAPHASASGRADQRVMRGTLVPFGGSTAPGTAIACCFGRVAVAVAVAFPGRHFREQ